MIRKKMKIQSVHLIFNVVFTIQPHIGIVEDLSGMSNKSVLGITSSSPSTQMMTSTSCGFPGLVVHFSALSGAEGLTLF